MSMPACKIPQNQLDYGCKVVPPTLFVSYSNKYTVGMQISYPQYQQSLCVKKHE